jgi:3-deoxy-D-manno-octulosonic-acid transferase
MFWNLVYLLLGVLLLPFFLWQKSVQGKRRAGWAAKFWGAVTPWKILPAQPRIWIHAVSLGEVNLLAPLLSRIASEHPDWNCYLTVTTVTGYELAQKKYPHLTISYAPLDFTWAIRRALSIIQPQLLILVELELWPNQIRIVNQANIPITVINGRLSEKSAAGYAKLSWLVKSIAQRITTVAAQTSEYATRFRQLGISEAQIEVTGSIKFDGAKSNRQLPEIQALRDWAGFQADEIIWLAGSTGEPEEQLILQTYQELSTPYPALRLVIVPRHPERFEEVAQLVAKFDLPVQRRSQHIQSRSARPVILVDVIGELGLWWGTAQLGFVGGSLNNRGGQNMIEPAAFGVATCFGPGTRNFRDVVQLLLKADAAVVVGDQRDLKNFIARCISDQSYATALGQRAATIVATQQGATERTLQLIKRVLQSQSHD